MDIIIEDDQHDIVPRLRQAASRAADAETLNLLREAARTIEVLTEYAHRIEVRELAEMAAAGSA